VATGWGAPTLRAVAGRGGKAYLSSQLASVLTGAAIWTLQDAKNRFSAVVEAAMAGEPQEVSRRGKPAVVVLSVEDFARLNAAAKGEKRPNFIAHLLAFPQPPAGSEDVEFERITVVPRDIELS
jgi:antitoxin Phd